MKTVVLVLICVFGAIVALFLGWLAYVLFKRDHLEGYGNWVIHDDRNRAWGSQRYNRNHGGDGGGGAGQGV